MQRQQVPVATASGEAELIDEPRASAFSRPRAEEALPPQPAPAAPIPIDRPLQLPLEIGPDAGPKTDRVRPIGVRGRADREAWAKLAVGPAELLRGRRERSRLRAVADADQAPLDASDGRSDGPDPGQPEVPDPRTPVGSGNPEPRCEASPAWRAPAPSLDRRGRPDVGASVPLLAATVSERLLPIVLALGAAVRSSTEAAEDLARLLNRVTEHLLGAGGPYSPLAVAELSLAGARAHLGADHPATVDALANLAISYQSAGRAADALAAFDQVVAGRERLRGPSGGRSARFSLDPEPLPPEARRVTRVAFFSGQVVPPRAGRPGPSAARDLLDRCLDEQGRVDVSTAVGVLGAEAPAESLPAARALGYAILWLTDAVEDLVRLLNQATAQLLGVGGAYQPGVIATTALAAEAAHLGPEHPATLGARANLATAYRAAGRSAEALALFAAVLAAREGLLGPGHPDTLTSLSQLATSYQSTGRLAEARAAFERVAVERDQLLGPEHADTFAARTLLATCHHAAGRRTKALALFEQIAADCARLRGPDDANTLNALSNLATAYRVAGRVTESLGAFERVLVARVRLQGPDHPETLAARSALAVSYQSAGRTARALASFGRVLADRDRLLGSQHPRTLDARMDLALAFRSAGRTAEALVLLQRLVHECDRVLGPDSPKTLTARANLAACLQVAGRTQEALPLLEQVAAGRARLLGAEHSKTLTAEGHLALAYQEAGRTAKALAIFTRVLADCQRVLGPAHPATVTARANLAAAGVRRRPRPGS